MKIGIIGAGFTGLSAGYELSKKGHDVTIFEASKIPGGLATGFKNKKWKWELESHYHHLFKTDYEIQRLAKEVDHKIIFVRPKTSTFYKDVIMQIDSPLSLMKFKHLSLQSRIRTGTVLAYLKITNNWKPLEKITAKKFLIKTMGEDSWKVLWQPLLEKKFGQYSTQIPASWFWARVKSRTAVLGYPEGGFDKFAQKICQEIKKNKGEVLFEKKVLKILNKKKKIYIKIGGGERYAFDKVICTLPTNLFTKITSGLPDNYLRSAARFSGIGATNLVLVLSKSFLDDGTYWLNINEAKYPFLAIVEHTNFMNSKNYGKEKIIYIGNYLENNNKYFLMSDKELLKEYLPYLKKINKRFSKSWIKRIYLAKAFFAQPIIVKNYSKKVLPFKTPIKNLFLANIQQVYPWDRGTNYAVELGRRVAKEVLLND
ncbi:MAG TPA: NAD(P)/FAD-dependent oxidoreductase [Patescibacteria group bacterium]|nr:NAD(P)/FAD-dependent oxidoreductase [Patescibacteria group bacterium]